MVVAGTVINYRVEASRCGEVDYPKGTGFIDTGADDSPELRKPRPRSEVMMPGRPYRIRNPVRPSGVSSWVSTWSTWAEDGPRRT